MASLANQTISSSYDGLIKTATDQPVPVSGVQLLEDGAGNSLAISIGQANQGVTITGALAATSLSGVLVDGVTATTQLPGDNSTKVATTAYVDAQVTASDLDFAGDSGTGAVDLDSQTFTIAGTANEIETVASGQTVTIGLPSSVTVGTLNATTLGGTLSTAAQPNITSVGTLSSLSVGGNIIGTGIIRSSDGTAASPSIQPGVDSNTGFFRPANDTIGITTTGTERMRIDNAGNVGIGSSSPISKLTLEGARNTNTLTIRSTDDNSTWTAGDKFGSIDFYSNDGSGAGAGVKGSISYINTLGATGAYTAMTFSTAGVTSGTNNIERMRIDADGNVGIGITDPNNYDVSDNPILAVGSTSTAGNSSQISILSGSSAIGYLLFGDGQTGNEAYRGQVRYTHSNDSLGLVTAGSERMRIDSSGNVGIGTSSPSAPLTVKASAGGIATRFLGRAVDGFSFLTFRNSSDSATNGEIGLSDGQNMLFYTGTTERMRVDSSGNVGIGTNSPDTKLTVASGLKIFDSNLTDSLTISSSTVSSYASTITHGDLGLEFNNTSSIRGYVFSVNSAEKIRIDNNGLKFNGDTAAANALDDYEEGTWVPTGVDTYTRCTYVKIGRMVILQGTVDFATSTSTSSVQIGGLPFASQSAFENTGSLMWNNASPPSNALQLTAYMFGGSSTLQFYWSFSTTTGWQTAKYNEVSGTDVIFTLVYQV